ncbi:MAG: PspC domain-containing protein [Solirubrobacterales bacterium]
MNSNTENKRLTRSRDDRFIGGVAAGIARHLNIDPVIVRIGFVLSIIFGGIGVAAYLILLAAVPIDGDPNEPAPQPDGAKRLWVIGGTVAMGVLALVSIGVGGDGFGGWMFGFSQGFWFGALIWALAIGGVVWLIGKSKDEDEVATKKADATPATKPAPASTVATAVAPAPTQNAPSPSAPAAAAATGEAPTAALDAEAPTTESPRTAETRVISGPVAPRDASGPSTIGRVMTIIAIVAAAGFTALLLAAISIVFTTVFGAIPMAAVVIALGVGLVVAALNNRHQLALWTLGAAVAIAIPMAVVSIADLRVHGDWGEVRERPVVADGIPGDGYQLAAGAMTIDMRDYPFSPGQTVDLPVESGLGATRVIVPDDICVSGAVDAKAGLAEIRGQQSSGIGFDRTFGDDASPSPRLNVDSELKAGLFLVVDDTAFRESGSGPNDDDSWSGTIDEPRLQDEAQDRALNACDSTGRDVPPDAGPDPSPAPGKQKAPSPPATKSAA